MTSEEKKEELIKKFKPLASGSAYSNTEWLNNAKACAIICVDEIIYLLGAFGYDNAMYDDFETGNIVMVDEKDPCEYWQSVKNELLK